MENLTSQLYSLPAVSGAFAAVAVAATLRIFGQYRVGVYFRRDTYEQARRYHPFGHANVLDYLRACGLAIAEHQESSQTQVNITHE